MPWYYILLIVLGSLIALILLTSYISFYITFYIRKKDKKSYKNDEILPYPKDLSRLFCGLPLVGTEEIGMPFLLNSFKFMPTTEREGIELEPTSNEVNRKLFESSALLYCQVLDYVANNKMKNAFHLARLCNKYNGTQISNQQFYNLYLSQYKRHLLNHNIVINEDNQFVYLFPYKSP